MSAAIAKKQSLLRLPSANPGYEPQFTFDLAQYHFDVKFRRYSRGDPIRELGQHFAGLLDAWELSHRRTDAQYTREFLSSCHWEYQRVLHPSS